jgi:hypothetical protein
MGAGFPVRLFASHLVAESEDTTSARKREKLCRRALEIFQGEPAPYDMQIDDSGPDPDMTDLQQTANLAARIGLADALLDRDKREEALHVLEEAIAYCPGWAKQYQPEAAAGGNDFHARFWADADIDDICARLRPETVSNAAKPVGIGGEGRPAAPAGRPQGFGKRAQGVSG